MMYIIFYLVDSSFCSHPFNYSMCMKIYIMVIDWGISWK